MREYLNGTSDAAEKFGEIFDGCNKTRGRFKYRNKLTFLF